MDKEKFDKWTEKNGTKIEYEYFNGIRYAFVTMNDGWIAVFESKGDGEYTPEIQAADMAHARSYCSFTERINVPFSLL